MIQKTTAPGQETVITTGALDSAQQQNTPNQSDSASGNLDTALLKSALALTESYLVDFKQCFEAHDPQGMREVAEAYNLMRGHERLPAIRAETTHFARAWLATHANGNGARMAAMLGIEEAPRTFTEENADLREHILAEAFTKAEQEQDAARRRELLRVMIPMLARLPMLALADWRGQFCKLTNITTGEFNKLLAEERALEEEGQPTEAAQARRQGLNFTDLGNAERFVAQHKSKVKYTQEAGWLCWTGKQWRQDGVGPLRLAKQTVRSIYAEAASLLDDNQRRTAVRHGLASESASRIEAMLRLARFEPSIAAELSDFDNPAWLFNCANGTVDLKTGQLKPHEPSDLLTKISKVEFNAEAQCPTWQAFLKRIMGDSDSLVRFLKRAIGYTLTGETGEQCFFLLFGYGANGKSTVLNVTKLLLGDYARTASIKTLTVQRYEGVNNDVARLAGARFVAVIEGKSDSQLNTTVIKQLTGDDTITARYLFKENFEFEAQFKLWLATNHKPDIRETDEGTWRRVLLIPFVVTIPTAERDQNLRHKLREELPGILNWALEGCLEWQRDGLQIPPEIYNATREYRKEQDALMRFIDAACLLKPNASVAASEFYSAYQAWCTQTGERIESQTVIGQRMNERFKNDRKAPGGRARYLGVGLIQGYLLGLE